MTLPTFLVVGAMKAGTTSLHRYLDRHPDVFMSKTKQLDFFVAEREWRRGIDWYRAQFSAAGSAKAVGETSPQYSKDPIFAGVPPRVCEVLPDVRIVYLLRHPVERIRSQHRHALAEWSDAPLVDALRSSRREYVVPSRYGHQLSLWLEHIPRERVHVLTTEALSEDPVGVLGGLFEFLQVGPTASTELVRERHNVAGGHRRLPAPVQRVRSTDWYRGMRHRVPRPVRHLAWRVSSRARPIDEDLARLPPELEADLVAELTPDLELLRELLPGFHCWGLLDRPTVR